MKRFSAIISFFLCLVLLSGCIARKSEEKLPINTKSPFLSEEYVRNYSAEAKKMIDSFNSSDFTEYVENEGNCVRIAKLMEKAMQGGEYTVCVFGGSISYGQGTTNSTFSYGYNVLSWWQENFPNAKFTYLNAGFGATNPEMASYRYDRDVKPFSPDFTIIDFTVNTYLDKDLKETYSALLSRLFADGSAVMGIHFSRTVKDSYNNGICEPDKSIPDKAIVDSLKKFFVPTVNYHKYIWDQFEKTEATWNDISADWIHPNNAGHKLASMLICGILENVKNNLAKYSEGQEPNYPVVTNKYSNLTFADTDFVRSSGSFSYKNGVTPSLRYRKISSSSGSVKVTLPENATDPVILISPDDFVGTASVIDSNGNLVQEISTELTSPNIVKIAKPNLRDFNINVNVKSGMFVIYLIGYKAN